MKYKTLSFSFLMLIKKLLSGFSSLDASFRCHDKKRKPGFASLANKTSVKKRVTSPWSRAIFFYCILSLGSYTFAADDIYPFDSAKKQQQFNRLTEQLRCLVCQNENLSASNADLAKDLRQKVYQMVQQNYTDQQIKQYLVNRYGEFVLFKPSFRPNTFILWTCPFILLLIGSIICWRIVKRPTVNPL